MGKRTRDLALVRRCVSGDAAAWAELVRRHEITVRFSLRRAFRIHQQNPSSDRLEDLTAELFHRLVQNDFARLRQYQGRSSLEYWLKVVAGNYAVDVLRKKRPVLSLDDPRWASLRDGLPDQTPSPHDALESSETSTLMRQLWLGLKPQDRRFVQLYYENEMSVDEVALRMNTSVGAIYSRKNRVRKKLGRLMKRYEITLKRRRQETSAA